MKFRKPTKYCTNKSCRVELIAGETATDYVAAKGGRCRNCSITYNAVRRGREPGIDVRVRIPHTMWKFFEEECEKENKTPAEFLRAFINAKVAAAVGVPTCPISEQKPLNDSEQEPSNVDFS